MPRPPRFPVADRAAAPRLSRAALVAGALTAGAIGALDLVAGRRTPTPVTGAGAVRCPSAEPAIVGPAVLAYITAQRAPTPQRFLYACEGGAWQPAATPAAEERSA